MRDQTPRRSRVVVVGASSGVGRCVALGLAERGTTVALLARRKDRLLAAILQLGPHSTIPAMSLTPRGLPVGAAPQFDLGSEESR